MPSEKSSQKYNPLSGQTNTVDAGSDEALALLEEAGLLEDELLEEEPFSGDEEPPQAASALLNSSTYSHFG